MVSSKKTRGDSPKNLAFSAEKAMQFSWNFLLTSVAITGLVLGSVAVYQINHGNSGPQGPKGSQGLQGPPGVNGTNGINGTTCSNCSSSSTNVTFLDFNQTLSVYVSKGGNDASGDGSIYRPYLTISKALTSITDASTTKRYQIIVGTGRFDESDIVLKPWIWLIGAQRTATRITSASTNITLSTAFTSGNYRFGLKDLLFSGSTNVIIDLQSLGGSGSVVLEMQSAFVNNLFVFRGRSSADFIEIWSCQILSQFLVQTGSGILRDSYLGSNVYVSDEGGGNVFMTLSANAIEGDVTFNKTTSSTFEVSTVASIPAGSLVLSGNGLSYETDAVSMPSSYTTIGSVTITFLTAATSIGFIPTNTSAWPVGTNTVQKALDYLRAIT